MARPEISSANSSPSSFYTAIDSEPSNQSTAASSPLHTQQPAPYRDVRPLPREVKAHCQIFLEEGLYLGAINLYDSLLGAGSSRQRPTSKNVYVPPPSHLAVLNTLLVHPVYTNRADKQSKELSTLALSYLRSLLEVAGPVNANFRAAFQFHTTPRWHRRQTGYSSDGTLSDESTNERDRDRDRLSGSLATENSVWSRGQDFWSTLGWALNCGTLYPQRWRYWKAWLDFMLDVLHSDWSERERLDLEAHEASGRDGREPTAMRQDSIIAMYMDQKNGPQGGFKAIMKALFADGGSLSTSSFHEVFDKEPRGRQSETRKRKRAERVDVNNGKFSDYLDDDLFSSGASEPPTPEKPRDPRATTAAFGTTFPGLVETIPLRMRLFQLLLYATWVLRKPSDVQRLYDAYASSLKVVPLPVFVLVVGQLQERSGSSGGLPPELRVMLLKGLFGLLLPAGYPSPRRVDPEGDAEARFSTAMLEKCYAPHPANTISVDDNAKLSIVVEAALQLLWTCDELNYSPALQDAILDGVDARNTKIKRKRTGKARPDPNDVLAAEALDASADRLRVLLKVIEATSDYGS